MPRIHTISIMLAIALISFVTIASGFSIGDAGYDTSRVGPSNAICERKLYNITVSANNTVFKGPLGHGANAVSSCPLNMINVLTVIHRQSESNHSLISLCPICLSRPISAMHT